MKHEHVVIIPAPDVTKHLQSLVDLGARIAARHTG